MSDINEPANGLQILCSDAVELVTEYLDNALSERDLAAFEAHLVDCEGCTVFVDQIKMTVELSSATSGQRAVVMPPRFDELLAALTNRAAQQPGTA